MRNAELLSRVKDYTDLGEFLNKGDWHDDFFRLLGLAQEALTSKDGIFLMGNGGSAAEATHIAAEFVGKCVVDHEPWPVISLNDSISAITAISNDWSFDEVFARQVKAHAKPKSLFIGLSTSGQSKNVLRGLETARSLGSSTALLTTERGRTFGEKYADVLLAVPSASTPRSQEIHLFWGHLLAEILEAS